jgi:pimeloyl-ACP methyl ester carboxylesterase
MWIARPPKSEGTPRVDLERQGFRRRDLPTPVGRVAVYEAGEGSPLLLLHGVGGGASSFYWYRIAPKLAQRYRVIAPDWVGFGASDHPARPILFDDYVTQIRAIAADVQSPFGAVAQSLAVGFIIAAMRNGGAKVERLAMLAPSGGFDFGVDAFDPLARNTLSRIAAVPGVNRAFYRALFHRRGAIQDWFEKSGFLDPAMVPSEVVDAGLFSSRQPNAAYAALPFLTGELRYDLAPLLRELHVPGLMLWGSDEIQIRPPIRERLERVNTDIPVIRIAKARSNFELEQPDATLAALEPFLGNPR